MQKKTGTAGSIVPPAAPTDAVEADTADPGAIQEAKSKPGSPEALKYGSVPAQPITPKDAVAGQPLSWIGVELKDTEGAPVRGMRFRITAANGHTAGGTTGADGKAKVEGIPEGSYDITFPDLDKQVWEPA